jgi:hypothetical protein
MLAFTLLASLCAALAVIQLALALRVRAKVPALSALDAPAPHAWPRLSIIVPARDEASGIEAALASKLACDYDDLEIVVVDDRSTDGTGDIARRLANDDPRLTVARVDTLPPGWLGKLHAMSVGAARASGDWILLSDADVHVARGALRRIIAHAEANAVDFVSVVPRIEPNGAVLDACSVATARTVMLGGRTWRANDDASGIGVGIGAFNLVRRRALEESPGLAHLRMEVADDVALGAMMKASGARCRFFAARGDVHLVLAETFADLLRSTDKIGFLLGFSIVRALAAPFLWLAMDLGVPIAALALGGTHAVLGAITLLGLTATHLVMARHFDAPTRGAFLWPLGSLLAAVLFARAGALAWWRGAIVWRGTRYSKADVLAGRRWVGGRLRGEAVGEVR